MFILELSDSEHEPEVSAASETGDITSELLPPPWWKPLTKARLHLQPISPSQRAHRAELGSPPPLGKGWGGGGVGAWLCLLQHTAAT